MSLSIPQSSPRANYLARKGEIDAAIARVLASCRVQPEATHVYHRYLMGTRGRGSLKTVCGSTAPGRSYTTRSPCTCNRLTPAEWPPQTEAVAGKILGLPMYPGLRDDRVRAAARQISTRVRN